MPRPPRPDTFDQVNFIVNYAMLGCTPPFFLYMECAREPATDLALILLVPTPFDIAQEIFDPRKSRRRKPARHGRKRPRFPGLPDTSAIIGQRMRGFLNPFNAFQYSPVKFVFPLLNIYEGVQILTAVTEGLGDTFYEGLLGVLLLDPENCLDLSIIVRETPFQPAQGGAGPPIDTFPLPTLIKNRGFFDNPFTTSCVGKPFTVHFAVTLRSSSPHPSDRVSIALGPSAIDKRAQSSIVDMSGGEAKTLDISADFDVGEDVVWGLGTRFGFYQILEARIVAFSTSEFPWPW